LLSLLNQVGLDTINDFTVGQDNILLSKAVFGSLSTAAGNPLVGADFITVTSDVAAGTATGAIVYNSANGKLFYNSDGSTAGFGASGGQFANLTSGLTLTNNDFKAIV
jgi:glycerophosphoryl diester phosphodiesterase